MLLMARPRRDLRAQRACRVHDRGLGPRVGAHQRRGGVSWTLACTRPHTAPPAWSIAISGADGWSVGEQAGGRGRGERSQRRRAAFEAACTTPAGTRRGAPSGRIAAHIPCRRPPDAEKQRAWARGAPERWPGPCRQNPVRRAVPSGRALSAAQTALAARVGQRRAGRGALGGGTGGAPLVKSAPRLPDALAPRALPAPGRGGAR